MTEQNDGDAKAVELCIAGGRVVLLSHPSCGHCGRPAGRSQAENGSPLCDQCAGADQAKPDYVTRAELVAALRDVVGPERYLPTEKFLLRKLADRLESK